MIHIQRILCPIDFSDHSRSALEAAVRLARWHEAQVDVVHIAPRPIAPSARSLLNRADQELDGSPRGERPEDESANARERLDRLIRQIDPGGELVTPVLAQGEIVSAILQAATSRRADVIVMGIDRPTIASRRWGPSVSEGVILKAPCPILVAHDFGAISAAQPGPPFRNVLCAVDFSPASRAALSSALELAQESQGSLCLLHVLESAPDRFEKPPPAVVHFAWLHLADQLRDTLRAAIPDDARHWCDIRERLAIGEPAGQIADAAAELDPDIIVMGARKHSGGTARPHATTLRVLRATRCPVLMVPEHDHAYAVASTYAPAAIHFAGVDR